MGGTITTTTECDDQGGLAEPENHQKGVAEFQVYMSSVWCPFGDFIRFLEAITIEVQECGFEWDPEGPSGKMRWDRRYVNDTGFLTVEWHSSEKQFSHRMMLNTRQAVRMLYTAFRRFVESAEYDPIRYEELHADEAFLLVLDDTNLDDLANTLVELDARSAESLIRSITGVISERRVGGPKLSYPLGHYKHLSQSRTIEDGDFGKWISGEWETWDRDQRMADVKDTIFKGGPPNWYGANLRELRSQLVEDWLALPEPPPRRNYRIPRQLDEDVIQLKKTPIA